MHHLLIVEDHEAISFAMKRYLEQLGYRVDLAPDYPAAAACLERQRYALVIADLNLGGAGDFHGLELLSAARRAKPDTHTILLTAWSSDAVVREGRERGASLVLRKPVPLGQLAQSVHALLSGGG